MSRVRINRVAVFGGARAAARHRLPLRQGVRSRQRTSWLTAIAAVLVLACAAAGAQAAPVWDLHSSSNTTAQPGQQFTFYLDIRNQGDDATDGTPYTLTVDLPSGMRAVSMSGASAPTLDCPGIAGATTIICTGTAALGPHSDLAAGGVGGLTVDVDGAAAGLGTARFSISGGGARTGDSTADPVIMTPTLPGFGIDAFDAHVDADASGTAFTRAGGHPYAAVFSFDVNTATDPSELVGPLRPVEPVKDVVTDAPPGFIGNPTGIGQCTIAALSNTPSAADMRPLCDPSSQIGTALIRTSGQGGGINIIGPLPVFNVPPPPDAPARFGFNAFGTVVVIDANVRSDSDYGVTATVRNASEGLALVGTTVTLWGVPSDASHDGERACFGEHAPSEGGPTCRGGAIKAFLRNPTSCTEGIGLPTTIKVASWFNPGVFEQATATSHLPPGYPFAPDDWGLDQGTTGCENVPFDPTLDGRPLAGSKAASPAGFAFDLTVPQDDSPTSIGQSDVRKTVVTLPAGVRVNPSSASGLQGCSSVQIALRSTGAASCPDAAKIGELSIDTPLLDEPLTGGIYLATPFDNPSGSLIGLYMVASGAGVNIKLAGSTQMDSDTGQITATFDNLPQTPFERVHLQFKAGPRAALTLPNVCGSPLITHAVFTGWNGREVTSDSAFTLTENARGQPCPPRFSPGFRAGTESNSAGSSSSFLLRVTRDDEDQQLGSLTVNMPSGLTGRIASVDLCSDAAARAGSCPAGARIGDVTVGAGSGSNPFFITNGRAFLTGPYKGAPFGVAIDVPAVAGPFDLGLVTVRSALFVDKHDATVRIVSDPLPTILQGIPLDVRDVRVDVNKPDFFINPTSCAVKTIGATVQSTAGARANVSDRFQAAECRGLGFRPKMVLTVGGRGHTRRGQTSPLSTRVTMPRGDANLRFVRVSLPTSINARLNTINDACTRAEFESDLAKCAHATAGSAVAVTPLLRDPLRGNVYFVKNGHPIPDLFVALRGQVDFDLIGLITIPGGKHLATTFDAVPDVPVTSFTLKLLGGPRTASTGAATNLCSRAARRKKVEIDYIGQNGRVRQVDQALKVNGCPKARKGGRHRRR